MILEKEKVNHPRMFMRCGRGAILLFLSTTLVVWVFHEPSSWAGKKSPELQVSGGLVDLQKAPLFYSKSYSLAKTWGPSIPLDNAFSVKKTYGRWIYGQPVPLKRMLVKDYAPNGWVYSLMLLSSGERASRSKAIRQLIFSSGFYGKDLWKGRKVSWEAHHYLNFLDSLVLSKKTLDIFSGGAVAEVPVKPFSLFPLAMAETAEKKEKGLGLTGVSFHFLREASNQLKKQRAQKRKRVRALKLQPRKVPLPSLEVKKNILGHYLSAKRLVFPRLSHNTVDTHLYLRAITARLLQHCPQSVRKFWKNKHWSTYQIETIQGEGKDVWSQLTLSGGNFFYSNQALRLAKNEAELAYLLIRPFILTSRLKEIPLKFQKSWLPNIYAQEELLWKKQLEYQSTKYNPKLDVGDDIAVDLIASRCLAGEGYDYWAGVEYIKKFRDYQKATEGKKSSAVWDYNQFKGLNYRLENVIRRLKVWEKSNNLSGVRKKNVKRFQIARSLWNF